MMEHSRSSAAFAEARKYIPGGVNSPVRAFRAVGGEPFFVERAAGAHIWDVDGNEYIDYVGTWGPAILGHAPAVVREAITTAAANGVSFGIPNPYEIEMARTIARWVPSIEKVRMVNSGTEATMSCIRLARGFTGRDLIVKFEGCYHGHVDALLVKAGSGALTHGRPDSAGVPAAFANLTITLPFNDVAALRSLFMAEGSKIAAVIVEPVPANAGLYLPREGIPGGPPAAVLAIRRRAHLRRGDDRLSPRARRLSGTQRYFTRSHGPRQNHRRRTACGAFGGRAEIMDYLSPDGPVYQAGTLSGNPLAMAAGLAQLRELERLDGWAKLEALGAEFEGATRAALRKAKRDYVFQRIGSMFCLYFTSGEVHNLADAQRSDRELSGATSTPVSRAESILRRRNSRPVSSRSHTRARISPALPKLSRRRWPE
jgi:glutamate-1-semialdehyde 2,1-aminomutase